MILELDLAISAPAKGPSGPLSIRLSHSAPYSAPIVSASVAPYGLEITTSNVAPYSLRFGVSHSARYDVLDYDPIARSHRAGFSILSDQALQAVASLPELTHNGKRIAIDEATISCDESSPYWIASIQVSERSDFASIEIGDVISLAIGGETFAFVVDGKTLDRRTIASESHTLSAVSPLAKYDAPFAAEISYSPGVSQFASATVVGLIGAVDWQLPEWAIPADVLAFASATPLSAARAIVESVGGLIESNPDGSVVCRRRHPVSVPEYSGQTPRFEFFDSEVLSSASRVAPVRGFNRIAVGNEGAGTGAGAGGDVLEYIGTTSVAGTIRAYPNPARAVSLVHTGDPSTAITPSGEVMRQETETAEFINGKASVRYPVASIVSITWNAADLGTVTASDKSLTAATAGYSLATVVYSVRSTNWGVSLEANKEVQFVLMDA